MSKKLVYLVLVLAFCMASSLQAQTIIWVSDNKNPTDNVAADQLWVDLLEANGYTVNLDFRNAEGRTLDDAKIEALNAADLIIISRDTDSGNYDDDDEVAQWNSIETPIMMEIAHIMRSSRWRWLDTTDTSGGQPALEAVDPGHPVFAGVSLDANNQVDVLQTEDSAIGDAADAGNGTVIARRADNSGVWIAEWEQGVEFYPGSGQFAGGLRMYFACGGIGTDGTYNLTAEGEKMFLNAVRYMLGASKRVKAYNPVPDDGSFNDDTWANLSWMPGVSAVSHDIYLGENLDDVNNGAEGTFVGNQADTFIVAGFPGFPYPNGLVPGTTYYWRVDEVNDADPNSPWKGDVWSFMIPPKTAYLPDPADTGESVAVNANLTWTGGFGAKLHTVYFGDNFDEVDNAAGGLPQGAATFSPGLLEMAKTYYWRVDEFDPPATHKGDIWSFTTEGAVGPPDPAKGAVDVTQTPVLTWAPGVFADTHEVYFGTDAASLELKSTGNLGSESYEPGQLEWNTTYYWRVDEANGTNADSPWTGPLWSFTTANFLIVDDMESYNDINEGEPASNRIYLAWLDGFDNPAVNGSVVGNDPPPFAEQTIVHGGNQSMPMAYNNAVGKSEATLTLTSNRDWTVNGINALTIWFRGNPNNAAETMYVVLNGSAGVDNDNPNAALIVSWIEWTIDLQAFADQGVNLTNVNSITLGLGNRSNPVAGGAGMMYYDDIRLSAP